MITYVTGRLWEPSITENMEELAEGPEISRANLAQLLYTASDAQNK